GLLLEFQRLLRVGLDRQGVRLDLLLVDREHLLRQGVVRIGRGQQEQTQQYHDRPSCLQAGSALGGLSDSRSPLLRRREDGRRRRGAWGGGRRGRSPRVGTERGGRHEVFG